MKALLKKYAPDDFVGWILVVVFGVLALLTATFTALAYQVGENIIATGLGLGATGIYMSLWMFSYSERSRKRSDECVQKRLAQILRELEKCKCTRHDDGVCE